MSEAAGFHLARLREVRARLVSHDWAWAADNSDTIAENWNRRRAARPSLFDGRVLLASEWRIADGLCEVALFETGFASFLAHRDAGFPDRSVANAFAAIVPLGADGAAILGRMGAHTANAGQVYFPCGTPDPADIRGEGEVDLAGSAEREFHEETGMGLPAGASERWLLLEGEGQLAFLRPVHFPENAAALAARMESRRRAEASPELDGFVVARQASDVEGERMPGFVEAYFKIAHAVHPSEGFAPEG